ncbi:MAG: hypothetical protein JST80_03105 [Bdellovibrionales bacterium]|nr:hypothetical protein [Bdellovibrionales bacterium]
MKTMIVMMLALVASPVFAETTANCAKSAPRGQEWKECKDTVRSNETVAQYLLTKSGNLYAMMKKGAFCQLTSNVDTFKVSQHANDAAMIYFTKSDDLYVLNKQDGSTDNDCPKAKKHVIMNDVKEYKMATNTNTTIVNAALTKSGKLVAWDNTKPVYTDYGVTDFQMNNCYGVKGKSFNSYVLFTTDYAGFITKVKGKKSGNFYDFIADKATKGRYDSIESFKSKENVCK